MADTTPVVCDDCGRHVPVYLIFDPETGEAIGLDILKVYCKKCAPEALERWLSEA